MLNGWDLVRSYLSIGHNVSLSDDLVALGRPHGISRENNEQTKLTMKPSPKTKDLRPIGVQLNKRF